MAEQFTLEQILGQARTVHHHQRVGCARAGIVHSLGHQLLACTRLSEQQHAGLRRPNPSHQLQHALEGRRTAHQSLPHGLTLGHAQGLHLLHEIRLFTRCI